MNFKNISIIANVYTSNKLFCKQQFKAYQNKFEYI